MALSQAARSPFRWLEVDATLAPAPTNGTGGATGGTAPHFTLSPVASEGIPTTGMLFQLAQPGTAPAVAGVGGFTITPWIRDPVTLQWASGSSFSAAYTQLFTTFDFDAVDIYFQIGNVSAGTFVYIGIAEQ